MEKELEDKITIIYPLREINGILTAYKYIYTENDFNFESSFKDKGLNYSQHVMFHEKHQHDLFHEFLDRLEYVRNDLKIEKTIKNWSFLLAYIINGKRHVFITDKTIYEVDPLLFNIFDRLTRTVNNDPLFLKAKPLDLDSQPNIKANDVDFIIFTDKPTMGTGDELYIAGKGNIYYTPLDVVCIESEEKAVGIFKRLVKEIKTRDGTSIADLYLNKEWYTYVALSQSMHRALVVKKTLFDQIVLPILKGEGEQVYINMINYISNHSDVPTNVVYRFKNY